LFTLNHQRRGATGKRFLNHEGRIIESGFPVFLPLGALEPKLRCAPLSIFVVKFLSPI
jgi:hypothetical protein